MEDMIPTYVSSMLKPRHPAMNTRAILPDQLLFLRETLQRTTEVSTISYARRGASYSHEPPRAAAMLKAGTT